MSIVTYFRSSSLGRLEYCEHAYFLEYVLGYKGESNLKAEQGTVVHKVMEVLANIKLAKGNSIEDEHIGEIQFDKSDWLEPTFLTQQQIDEINFSRSAKSIYKTNAFLEDGHFHLGVELVDAIFDKAYEYYKKHSKHNWTRATRSHCLNWTWMALDYNNGQFDPRKRNIFRAEEEFNFKIEKDWAKFEYELMGRKLEGHLGLKGTIDLITDLGNDLLEVVDYKTGQRKNWATGKEKTYKKILEDTQLLLYYYALKNLYPDKHILLTIFFIRDGGPFTVGYEPESLEEIEEKLRSKFEQIKNMKVPRLLDPQRKDFRCAKLCHYAKNNLAGTKQSMCEAIHEKIKDYGIEYVIDEYTREGFDVDYYHSPGSVEKKGE